MFLQQSTSRLYIAVFVPIGLFLVWTATAFGAGNSAITVMATDISYNDAQINAIALPASETKTYGWFEWGNTPDFGHETVKLLLGTNTYSPFNEILKNLTTGTTYFFRPVIENIHGVSRGAVFSFHTFGVPAGDNFSPSYYDAQNIFLTRTTDISDTEILPTPKAELPPVAHDTSDKESLKIEVVSGTDSVTRNERLRETIHLENTTDVKLKGVVVRVIIPNEAEYISTGGDSFLQNGKVLTHEVGDLNPREKKSLLLWVVISANVPDKTPIETIAVVDWGEEGLQKETQNVGRAVAFVDINKVIAGSAAAVGASKGTRSIFPQNLKEWGSVIELVFILIAAYMIFLVMRGAKEEEIISETGETPTLYLNTQPPYRGLGPAGVPHRKYNNDPFITEENVQKKLATTKTAIPLSPVKKFTTQKGIAPDNLPV